VLNYSEQTHVIYICIYIIVFCKKYIFSGNPCAKIQEAQKSEKKKKKKKYVLHEKIKNIINFALKTNGLRPQGSLDFPSFSVLRYVGVFSVRLLMIGVYFLLFSFIFFRSIAVYLKLGSRLTFFVIFLHFLQKYRCVLKIWFSAYMFLTCLLTFLLMFLLTFILTL